MNSVEQIINILKSKARPDQLEGMARFGLAGKMRLGVSIPELRKMGKDIGKNHNLALDLWKSGIQEARILASMIDQSEEVNEQQMENWVKDFDSWDVCDQVCGNLFEKVDKVKEKIFEWSDRKEEFVKRSAFTLIACLAWHDKQASDEDFIRFLPLIKKGADDSRNFVKKAVNWALRNIGKRNHNLNKIAIKFANDIQKLNTKTARWIATDAIRELKSEAVQNRLTKKIR
jgi:3-methyladenine DNA glycosylase AlkD